MRYIYFLIIMLLLSGQSIASTLPLPLDEKSKIAFSKLSAEELCESTENDNFINPRNICTSWETNIHGLKKSCLEWGAKVNKQNYLNEFKNRNYAENKCILMEQEKDLKKKNEFELSRKKCQIEKPTDTLGMKLCSGIELTNSENNLKSIYSELLALLDRVHSNKENPSPSESLSEGQKNWEEYSENQCQISYRLHYRGSAAGLFYTGCKLNITNQRIKELSEMHKEWTQRGY